MIFNSTRLPSTSDDFVVGLKVTLQDDLSLQPSQSTALPINFTTTRQPRPIPCQVQFDETSITITFFFTLIFCLSVIGNSMVIVTIVQQRWMRTVTNMYLLNLAITDLMLSVICMPQTLIGMLLKCFVMGRCMCKIFAYLQPVAVTASAYTLTVIAFERYYAICRPLHARAWQTKSHAVLMIILVWVISLVCNIAPLFVYDLAELLPGQYNCRFVDWFSIEAQLALQLYLTIALFIFPLCIMVVLYGRVIITLRQGMMLEVMPATITVNGSIDDSFDGSPRKTPISQRIGASIRRLGPRRLRNPRACAARIAQKQSSGNSPHHSHKSGSEYSHVSLRSTHMEKSFLAKQRVIRMLVAVVIEFFLCWTPIYIYFLVFHTGRLFNAILYNGHLHVGLTIISYISSCCNPITYCFLNDKFRQAFLYAFGCRNMAQERFDAQVNKPYSGAVNATTHKASRSNQARLSIVEERSAERVPLNDHRYQRSCDTAVTALNSSPSDNGLQRPLAKQNGRIGSQSEHEISKDSEKEQFDLNRLTVESAL